LRSLVANQEAYNNLNNQHSTPLIKQTNKQQTNNKQTTNKQHTSRDSLICEPDKIEKPAWWGAVSIIDEVCDRGLKERIGVE
jgi:hypothetical protein